MHIWFLNTKTVKDVRHVSELTTDLIGFSWDKVTSRSCFNCNIGYMRTTWWYSNVL